MMEEWNQINGYPDYEVSSNGRIRSVERYVPSKKGLQRICASKILKQFENHGGYLLVSIRREGKQKTFSVHTMVLRAFLGEPPSGYEGCHDDGDKKNNNIKNLRWDTPESNRLDKIKHGTHNFGANHGAAKLSESDVLFIRNSSLTNLECAKKFGVARAYISLLRRGKTWKHLNGADYTPLCEVTP